MLPSLQNISVTINYVMIYIIYHDDDNIIHRYSKLTDFFLQPERINNAA